MRKRFLESASGLLGVALVLGGRVDAAAARGSKQGTAFDRPAVPDDVSLPDHLSFHLEDGRHHSPGLSLSFALPRVPEYECRRMEFRQERHGSEIEISFLRVLLPAARDGFPCRAAKESPPIKERVLLPPEPGNYRLTFVKGDKRDVYSLTVTPNAVVLEPRGVVTFTGCEEIGEFARVDPRWLWLRLSFLTQESHTKLREKRDKLLQELEALGAKPLVPPAGRYLMDGFVQQVPSSPGTIRATDEERIFLWDGNWTELRAVAARYSKYAKIGTKRPVMQIWLTSRDYVVSTYGGAVSGDQAGEP